jgi:hypothetical protein
MRKLLVTSLAAGLMAISLPAAASSTGAGNTRSDTATSDQARADSPDRRICVREALSDSRMRRQVCHTAREWQQLQGDVPSAH